MDPSRSVREYIEAVRPRIADRHREVLAAAGESPALLEEFLEELYTALEELQVSEEELREQNEELVAAQQMLAAERARYRDLFDFAPDAYLVTDAGGVVREANRAAQTLLGVGEQEVRGKPLVLFVAKEDRRDFHTVLSALPRQRRRSDWELRLRPRGGGEVPVSVTCVRSREVRNEVRWSLRDLSLRRRAEAQARELEAERVARSAAEAASAAKSNFLAVISHELRTPLTAIMAYAELLQEGIPEAIPDGAREQVGRIDLNARHLLQLIEEILGFTRMEQGRPEELHPEPVAAAEVAQEAAVFVRPLAERKGLALEVSADCGGEPLVTDRAKVRQVLVNLLFNAVKFTERGGVVLRSSLEGDRVRFCIRDTGIGIPPEHHERIFEPFWQVDQSHTRSEGGTGLGLPISRRIARLLGGDLRVESAPGEGSAFILLLPLQAPEAAPPNV